MFIGVNGVTHTHSPDPGVTHAVAMVTVGLQLHEDGALGPDDDTGKSRHSVISVISQQDMQNTTFI